jgi:hypothetical protein
MIASLATNIENKIVRRNELEQIRENKQAIADTYRELAEAGARLRQTLTSFDLIRARLTTEQVEEVRRHLQMISERLRTSRERFITQYRQVREISAAGKQIEQLDNFLAQAWASYVLSQTYSQFELLDLVISLPEVNIQGDGITAIRQRLENAQSKLPRRELHLIQFDADLQALQNSLANLSGLDTRVTEFLRRVQKGRASVADLTDDILDWCRANNRATAFKISFGQSK